MKKITLMLAIAFSALGNAFAADAFEFVNLDNGQSYIKINENIDAFKFNSDFKSIGNSGKVGYVIYADGLADSELEDYMRQNAGAPQFGKKIDNGLVSIENLNAGDRIGFYLVRNNGAVIYDTSFVEKHGVSYIDFMKNGVGSSKDEWMSVENARAERAPSGTPTGAPLPGALATLLVGCIGAVAAKKR